MAKIKHERLSSDFLYTYTKRIDNIKLMLRHGLRHSLNVEKLPYKNSEQHNFIVCFCDILPEQSDYHKSVYGDYGLAFTKVWGITNSVSPLRYIHENSPGATANYVHIKNDMRESRGTLKDGNQLDYFLTLLLHSTARKNGLLTKDTIKQEIGNAALQKYIDSIDASFQKKKDKYGDDVLRDIFNDWVIPVLNMLEKTIDELEQRDGFVRIYSDDFREVKNKILYDEREWRSVKNFTEADINGDPTLQTEAIKNKFLPEKYNLKFELKDIVAILVETDAEKNEVRQYIINELPHLKGAENLVFTFTEHIASKP